MEGEGEVTSNSIWGEVGNVTMQLLGYTEPPLTPMIMVELEGSFYRG